MIDFSLSEEEQLAQGAARDFAERRLRPNVRKHEKEGVPAELADELCSLQIGWADVPADLGGAALGPLAQAVVLEELGAVDVGVTLALDRAGPARYPVLALGGADECRFLLDGRAALVVDRDRALRVEAGTLHGGIDWCPCDRPEAVVIVLPDAVWVVAGSDAHPTGKPGLALEGASLRFEGARPRVVLHGDTSLALAEVALYQSALLVGLSRAAYQYTARYARERVTFGRPLAQHQAVAFMIVEMAMGADAARLATWRASLAIAAARAPEGEGSVEEASAAASMALEESAEHALATTDRAVQLLGGHGYLKDHPVEKWMREARALTLAWGNG